jgi:hypothetical protein
LYNAIPDGVERVEASVLDESVFLDLLQKKRNGISYDFRDRYGVVGQRDNIVLNN